MSVAAGISLFEAARQRRDAYARLGPLAAFGAFGVFWGAWGVLLPDVKQQMDASVAELGAALLLIAWAPCPRCSSRAG